MQTIRISKNNMATPSPHNVPQPKDIPTLDITIPKSNKSKATAEGMIYETAYKKGNLLQKLHFRFDGSLIDAIIKVKQFCAYHHLMHIHTVPFIVDLDLEMTPSNGTQSDPIDITQE